MPAGPVARGGVESVRFEDGRAGGEGSGEGDEKEEDGW